MAKIKMFTFTFFFILFGCDTATQPSDTSKDDGNNVDNNPVDNPVDNSTPPFFVAQKTAEINTDKTYAGGEIKCLFSPSEDEDKLKEDSFKKSLKDKFIVYGIQESIKNKPYDWYTKDGYNREEVFEPGKILEFTYRIPNDGQGKYYRCFGYIFEKNDKSEDSGSLKISFYSDKTAYSFNSPPEEFKSTLLSIELNKKFQCKGTTNDRDVGDKLSYKFFWEKSQILSSPLLPGLLNTLSFTPTLLNNDSREYQDVINVTSDLSGRYLRCKILATDGKNITSSYSEPTYIENLPPKEFSAEIKFLNKLTKSEIQNGYVGEIASCLAQTTDPENDSLRYKYAFYMGDLNSFKLQNDTTKIKNLAAQGIFPFSYVSSNNDSFFKLYEGDSPTIPVGSDYRELPIFCLSFAVDDKGNKTLSLPSESKFIKNRPPYFPQNYKPKLNNSSYARVGDKLYCLANNLIDPDGDSVTYNYKWQVSTNEVKESLEASPQFLDDYIPTRELSTGSFETVGDVGSSYQNFKQENDGSLTIVPEFKRKAIRCIAFGADIRSGGDSLFSEDVSSKQIVVKNINPTISFNVEKSNVKVGDTFSCKINKEDLDGDSFYYESAIYSSSDNIAFQKIDSTATTSSDSISFTIPSGSAYSHKYLKCSGDIVETSFQTINGTILGVPQKIKRETASFFIQNSPPSAFSSLLKIQKLEDTSFSDIQVGQKLKVGDKIKCIGTTNDIDSDTISYQYLFKYSYDKVKFFDINTLYLYKSLSIDEIEVSSQLSGAYIRCTVIASDKFGGATESSPSSMHTLENSPPIFTQNPSLSLTPVKVGEIETCSFNSYDIDLNTVKSTVYFIYKDDLNSDQEKIIQSSESSSVLLPTQVAHKYIACRVLLDDGNDGLTLKQSDFKSVLNSQPYFNQVKIISEKNEGSVQLGETITCTGDASDKDLDSLSHYKAVFKTILNDESKTEVIKEVSALHGSKFPYTEASLIGLGLSETQSLSHAKISCKLYVKDGYGYDNSSAFSAYLSIKNNNPTSPINVNISNLIVSKTETTVGDEIKCSHADSSDVDGDSINYTYYWYFISESDYANKYNEINSTNETLRLDTINSLKKSIGESSNKYKVKTQDSHGVILCQVKSYDAYEGYSLSNFSSQVFISNTPSFVKTVSLKTDYLSSDFSKDSNEYTISNNIRCEAVIDDIDGDISDNSLVEYSFIMGYFSSPNNVYVWNEASPLQNFSLNNIYKVKANDNDYQLSPSHNLIKCNIKVTDSWDRKTFKIYDSMNADILSLNNRLAKGINTSPSAFEALSFSKDLQGIQQPLFVKDNSADVQSYFECKGSASDVDSFKEPISYSTKYEECLPTQSGEGCTNNSNDWMEFYPITLTGDVNNISNIESQTNYYKKSYIYSETTSTTAQFEYSHKIFIGKEQAHKKIRCVITAKDTPYNGVTVSSKSPSILVTNSIPKFCLYSISTTQSTACLNFKSEKSLSIDEGTVLGSYPNKIYTENFIENKLYVYDRDGDSPDLTCTENCDINSTSPTLISSSSMGDSYLNDLDNRTTTYYKKLYFKPGFNFSNKTTPSNNFKIKIVLKDSYMSTPISDFIDITVNNTDRDTVLSLGTCSSTTGDYTESISPPQGLSLLYQITENILVNSIRKGLFSLQCGFSAVDQDGDSITLVLNRSQLNIINNDISVEYLSSSPTTEQTPSLNTALSTTASTSAASPCNSLGCQATQTQTSIQGYLRFYFNGASNMPGANNFKGCYDNYIINTKEYNTCPQGSWSNGFISQSWTNSSPDNLKANKNALISSLSTDQDGTKYSLSNAAVNPKPCPNNQSTTAYCFLRFYKPSIYVSNSRSITEKFIGFIVEDIDETPVWDGANTIVNATQNSYLNYEMNSLAYKPSGVIDRDCQNSSCLTNIISYTYSDVANNCVDGNSDGIEEDRLFNWYATSNGIRLDNLKTKRINALCGCYNDGYLNNYSVGYYPNGSILSRTEGTYTSKTCYQTCSETYSCTVTDCAARDASGKCIYYDTYNTTCTNKYNCNPYDCGYWAYNTVYYQCSNPTWVKQ